MPFAFVRTIPVLRSFDEAKTQEFYIGFLGFETDWTHRFEPTLPLYMQVSRNGIVLHLSGHHGDATPGAHIRIELRGLEDVHAELVGKDYGMSRPGLERPPWGGLEMTVTDPAGNRITFVENARNAASS